MPVGKPSVKIEDVSFSVGPTGSVPIRTIRPVGTELLPVVMYFHGGGWVLGDRDTHDRLVREIAVGAEAAVVLWSSTTVPLKLAIQPLSSRLMLRPVMWSTTLPACASIPYVSPLWAIASAGIWRR
ncbi:MAG: alpha/beta hydrolase [Acetobacteraceae bacterium]|nr:alpha/beta hydrolase [Acetobacteraceae bacterium]